MIGVLPTREGGAPSHIILKPRVPTPAAGFQLSIDATGPGDRMFKTITRAGLFALCSVCFGAVTASAATARGAIGQGSGRHFGAAIHTPRANRSGGAFGSVWDRGSPVQPFGRAAIYRGSAFYEATDSDDQLYEGMDTDEQHRDRRSCRVERRVFEDFDSRRVRSVVVCD
jgi:hypothetical protein